MSNTPFPQISVSLPFAGEMNIEVTPVQRDAAWALYVELSTRVAVQRLQAERGSIREALNSLYSLFEITRKVLKEAGPEVANGPQSVGPAALEILNEGIRPFLAEWHTKFSRFELSQAQTKGNDQSRFVQNEVEWKEYDSFFEALEALQDKLAKIVNELARLAGVEKA